MCLLALLCARPGVAQESEAGAWQAIGPIPVDQAGAGRRGYSLPVEGTDLAAPQAGQLALHVVAANNFYVEHTGDFDITERSETHTLAIDYRRGFKAGVLPRIEIGAQLQLSETDAGVLNGFITRFEDFVHAPLRSKTETLPPLGTYVVRDGREIYQSRGNGRGFGDMTFVAKALLHEAPAARGASVAARVAVNVAGRSDFSEGNFVGAGLSVASHVAGRLALHGDLRASVLLDRVSTWELPLRRGVVGFSVGPEVGLTRQTSINLQVDGTTSPYLPTGTTALDSSTGDVAFSLSHRFPGARRSVVAQFYGRENMNLPFSIRWNTDPDFAIGLKVTVR